MTRRMRDLRPLVLPPSTRRTLTELSDELELMSAADRPVRLSAFWTMLALSATIAAAGVLGDSTATVIGAMIIAPLSTPIMGIALAAVKGRGSGSVLLASTGAIAVVAVGVLFSFVLPTGFDPSANSQITSRVSPGLVDLVAATATGLAGAVALARRDVAAVLPGVAIAISLVPPLAVVGVCLGLGRFAYASGALLLFLSNLVALVLCGIVVFAMLGYVGEAIATNDRPGDRRTRVTLIVLTIAVVVPLGLNTVLAYVDTAWERSAGDAAENWLQDTPGASIQGVDVVGSTIRIAVRAPGDLPPAADLLEALDGRIPDGFDVELDTTVGEVVHVGTVGDPP